MEQLRDKILSYTKVSDEELTHFFQFFKPLSFKKGDFIQKEGQYCRHFYFVKKGCLSVYTIYEGQERVVDFITEGNFFTDFYSYLRNSPSLCFIKALENTEVSIISKEDFDKVYDRSQAIERFNRKYVEEAFLKEIIKSTNKNALSNEERYLRLLRKRPSLSQRVPQYLIASYLGVTPVGLSKIRKRLSRRQS